MENTQKNISTVCRNISCQHFVLVTRQTHANAMPVIYHLLSSTCTNTQILQVNATYDYCM